MLSKGKLEMTLFMNKNKKKLWLSTYNWAKENMTVWVLSLSESYAQNAIYSGTRSK